MHRRELIKMIGLLTGAAVIGTDFLLTGCKTSTSSVQITPQMVALLDEVGETIIPATSTPGARAAKIGEFMKIMVNDCYSPSQQKAFTEGVSKLDDECKTHTGKPFLEASVAEREKFLIHLEEEAKKKNAENRELDNQKRKDHDQTNSKRSLAEQKEFEATPEHYYTMVKQLTLLGFFTSKTGMTETLRHIPVPGRYDGEMAYNAGDRAWAE
ncbi:gluconate 2-dehydrogenase subunit 3 family protein [Terrimonas sp. NA20]|uniref:Gluconate 2-dehydrogenase subunit 3 family protein n=1 Tax=Terrimonas ginsenosidimutans TaxID=2908004 RepID=A0ABS9KS77_9BACT|nr:gluconate 2-dehydrogenase subunit 3 family protein [Terrimonas ginsenosidimutans]MCG2615159.1 gluconate 2-dehydrogenase subunit 3 family protein [Terrimonas ginsenosidimutans]